MKDVTNNISTRRGVVKADRLLDDDPFIKHITDFYREEWKRDHPGDKNPREWFYVSDVGRCPRSIFYQFKQPEKKRNLALSTLLMFKFGELFHEEVMRVFRALGYTTGKDIEFGTWSKVGFMKRGRIDALVKDPVVPAMFITTEVKSKNPYAFAADEPNENEVDQLLSYMADIRADPYFKSRGGAIADFGYIFYIERSGLADMPFAVWKVHYSEERIEAIRREFRSLHRAIKQNSLPERPYTRDDINCQYCRFRDYCWEGVPLPEQPKHEADDTIEVPAMEIVESMAETYVRLKAEIKEKETELELAEKVLKRYFQGTGQDEMKAVRYEKYNAAVINEAYLLRHAAKLWPKIAKPQVGLMREAVESGLMTGTVFEGAFTVEVRDRLKIKKEKKGKGE